MSDFFSFIENTSEASRYGDLLSKDVIVTGNIKKPNGS